MALLIDRMPVPAVERSLQLVTGGMVAIKPLQPVVWISVSSPQDVELPLEAPRFPAVIDTAFNQTLLIQDRHLHAWGGVNITDLQVFPGEGARYGSQTWPFRIADIWLHSIASDDATAEPSGQPYCLETHPGILVVSESERRQRLPVLGLRALAWNRVTLRLEFDRPTAGWLSLEAP